MSKKNKKNKDKKKKRNFTLLSCGSTLLNLAVSGFVTGIISKGHYGLWVGDSAAGKTFLGLTLLAEASLNKEFKDYRLIYDNVEDGALMDIEKYYGKALAERIEPPAYDEEGEPLYSETIEDMYYGIDDALKDDRPFIWLEDSMDALTSEAEKDKFQETKNASRQGKDTTGSYGDGKAKKNSAMLRTVVSRIKKEGSVLIILSQTRDNLGFGFEKKTRSGGRSLKFYASCEIWLNIKSKIKKTVKGKERKVGVLSRAIVKKNRYNGKERDVLIPIYNSYGIDDIGSCIDYLVSEKYWKKSKASIIAPEFKFKGGKDNLAKHIADNKLEKSLQNIVQDVWDEIEEACELDRKPRY